MQPVALAPAPAASAAYGDTTTAALLASLAGALPGAPVTLRGTLDNAAPGSVLDIKAGTTLGQVNLNGGAVRGGTLRLSGGALRFNTDGAYALVGTLDGVRVLGGLAVGGGANPFPGYGAVLALRGVTFAGLSGAGRGAVNVTGAASELRALDTETLDHVDLRFDNLANKLAGPALTTAPGTTLSLGPDASLNVASLLTVGGGGTLRIAGAVAVQPGGTLAIAPGTTLARIGAGSLAVAAGARLSLGWTGTAAPLDGLAGAVIDGTLALSGSLSSTAYAAALGGVAGAGGVSLFGTLDNTGAVLSPGGTVAGRLTLSGVLKGGTAAAGTLTLGPAAALDGVTLRGPVALAGVPGSIDAPPPAAFFRGGLGLVGVSGAGPGALTLSRLSLQASDTERLDNAAVRLLDAALSAADGSRLTLGAGLSLGVAGSSALNNATNQGAITVEGNATLTVDGSFVNAGTLALGLGSRLSLSGTTTPGLAALAGGATGPGTVGLAPNATWDNGGATLVLLAGSRLNGLAALNPTLKGGTVANAGGSLGFTGTVVLDGVAWRGAFAPIARADFQFRGGTAVQGLGGARALIDLAASGSSLDLPGALDNTDLRLAGGSLSTSAPGPVLLGAGATLSIAGGFSTRSPARGVASGLSNAGAIAQAGDADYAALSNSGTIAIGHGTARAATLANTGLISLDAATLTVASPAALGGTVAFLDPTARLVFQGSAGPSFALSATLRDFQNGDSIDLQGVPYGPGLSASLQGDAVQVSQGGTAVARFGLSGGTYAADQFSLAADGAGGTLLRTTHRLGAPSFAGAGRDFDAAYYLAHNPDVAAAHLDPLQHYLDYGWKEGRDPNAYFSTAWYLNQNPDVAAAGVNPLQHYEDHGWREGRDPGPNFSTAAYLAANPDVRAGGIDPLQHFLNNGRAEGRSAGPAAPHPVGPQDPLVDRAWYLAQHPDVAASGEDASAHYHRIGWRLAYNPDPFFDTTFYLKANPDVAAAGLDPLAQFEASGWREGREPSLAFSDRQYLAANPDVAAAGLDPLAHYLAHGRWEGRPAFVNGPFVNAPAAAAPDPLIDRAFYFAQVATVVPASADAAASYDQGGWRQGLNPDAFFDTGYYLAHNPDVRAAGINPLRHYEDYGWKEGRDPSAAFSTGKYLAAYPDVRTSGADPLASFLATGQAVGRAAFGA
jgi:hypothetical protein